MTRGELVVFDTNVLLTATDRSRPGHERARRLFARCLRFGVHPAACGQIMREYLVVATRPASENGLGLSCEDAVANVTRLGRLMVLLPESADVVSALREIVLSAGISGKRIHDANIAAVMQTHAVSTLVTENTDDFRPFSTCRALTIDSLWNATCEPDE